MYEFDFIQFLWTAGSQIIILNTIYNKCKKKQKWQFYSQLCV